MIKNLIKIVKWIIVTDKKKKKVKKENDLSINYELIKLLFHIL